METYWKSTTIAPPAASAQDHAHQFQPHRPLSVSTTSPSMRSSLGQSAKKPSVKEPEKGGFVTASSLAGDYLHLVVQVTRDYVPVVYPSWILPYPGLTLGVSDITAAQYKALGRGGLSQAINNKFGASSTLSLKDWHETLQTSIVTLEDVLMVSKLHFARTD